MSILPNLEGPADLRGLDEVQLAQLAVEIRETIIGTVADDRRPPRLVARRRRADDRPPPAARIAARPDRLGHRPPGVSAQAADRPARAVRHAPPARRRRRLPAPHASRRTTSSTAGTPGRACRSPRAWPRRATCATAGADRGRRRRRGADERPVASRRSTTSASARPRCSSSLNDNEMSISPTVGALLASTSARSSCRRPGSTSKTAYDRTVERIPVVGRDRPRAVAGGCASRSSTSPSRASCSRTSGSPTSASCRATTCTPSTRRFGQALELPGPGRSSTSGRRRAAAIARPRPTRSASTARPCRR